MQQAATDDTTAWPPGGDGICRWEIGTCCLVTFCMRRSQGEMYIGHGHLGVLSVPHCISTLLHRPGCNMAEW